MFDFRQARSFAGYILEKRLHEVKSTQAKLVHLAFNTSMIVSYSRPFHMSNERTGMPRVSLREKVIDVLDDDERGLHARVIQKRDQALAHSDAMAHEFQEFDYSGRSAMFYKVAFEPLTHEDTRMLSRMVRRWIRDLEELRLTAKQSR